MYRPNCLKMSEWLRFRQVQTNARVTASLKRQKVAPLRGDAPAPLMECPLSTEKTNYGNSSNTKLYDTSGWNLRYNFESPFFNSMRKGNVIR